MTAEGRLLEEPRNELVILDFADVLFLQCSFPHPGLEEPHGALRPLVIIKVIVLGHIAARTLLPLLPESNVNGLLTLLN